MNRKIIEFYKELPKIYTESDGAFWDDEHISKFMLEAHLNPNCDSASRKQDGIIRSANWITEFCGGGSGKKMLDLGCGPVFMQNCLQKRDFK